MQSDKREVIYSGKNPSWGQWIDASTFQTYSDIHLDHTVQFLTKEKSFTLRLNKNAHLKLLDHTQEFHCFLEENTILLHQGLPQLGYFHLGKNAQLKHQFIHQNDSTHSNIEVFLNQSNAQVDWRDGVSLKQDQTFDFNMKVDHVAPKTQSNCILKSIIDDTGRLKFFCDIFVQKQANNCITHQRNLNHILSPHGHVTSLPHLHIFNRNIEASHGTATQPIPKEVLFYLQSRGLSAQEAEQTYLESFLGEIYHHAL